MNRQITNIIIHCSDSEWGNTNIIRKWHTEPPRNWRDIAYHFVVLNGNIDPDNDVDFKTLNGSIECGRILNDDGFIDDVEIGAHTLGYNANSVGICLIGIKTFTENQFDSLMILLKELMGKWNLPASAILGHYETESGKKEGKTCPNFDMGLFRQKLILFINQRKG